MRNLPKIFSQRDPQWAAQRLGTVNGSTLGQYGCYVTSFAMVAAYYGKDINPSKLDDFFTNGHVYYNAQGNHNDPAKFAADNMLQVIYGDIVFQKAYDFTNAPADLNLLKTLLADPTLSVILEVDFNHNPGDGIQTHFVVAVECDGKKVVIADPWQVPGSVDDFTKNYGNNPAQTILKFVVYKGNVPATASTSPAAGADMYGGLDLNNKDSMKVCVDTFNKVQHGELIGKDKYDADLKVKEDTIKGLNGTIENDNTTIKTQQAKIDAFPAQLKALQDQIDVLSPQSDELVQTKKLLEQAELDKEGLRKTNQTLTNSNAQLKNTSYTTAKTSVLAGELLKRLANRAVLKS